MGGIVVVGAQWGDEGKGKVVDFLAERADFVVRFQGGHNAGHTLVLDGRNHVLQLVPTGIYRPQTTCIIGSGVVVDPGYLLSEIESLAALGLDVGPRRLRVSAGAPLILPWHGRIDLAREALAGPGRIGTTGKGIGPAYEDLVGRRACFVRDLFDAARLAAKVERQASEKNAVLMALGAEPVDTDLMCRQLVETGRRIEPYVDDTSRILSEALLDDRKVVFEGAQGTLLDVLHGSYPYVTSSHAVAATACVGSGIGPTRVSRVLGVAKAYTTRVGAGPLPTELHDEVSEHLRSRGQEFGVTSGRARRCGWLDLVVLRYAAQLNGLHGLYLNKLDVLTGLDKIKVCTAYQIDGQRIGYFPADAVDLGRVTPHYETLHGWHEPLGDVRRFADLPPQARDYVTLIESELGIPAYGVSVGPARDQVIVLHKLW